MQISLHAIVSHDSFDWECRRSKEDLLENMVEVVKNITKVKTLARNTLNKAMIKLYDLTRKPKNVRKGRAGFQKQEELTLQDYILEIEEGEAPDDAEDESVVEKKKRKNYADLKTVQVKKARVENVVQMLRSDDGLEGGVFDRLKEEMEVSTDKKVSIEEWKLSCLNLMKILKLSDKKYDDLRFWILDVMRRGFSLASMPTSRALKEKVNREMIPPDMKSSATGAKFELQDALFHTGRRFLERPDIKSHLRPGITLLHQAKIGSDFQTGLGKISQRKECDFDEDGSHNSGFQTLKLSLGNQTLFANKSPGGSELLRLYGKTTEKDTQEKIIKEMEQLDAICEEMPVQEVDVQDVGKVNVKHQLINTLHDGKERLIMAQHKVATFHQQGIIKKPPGFGHPAKISTQTCQVCLTDPKTYNQELSLSAEPVLFSAIKTYSLSPMHMRVRVFEAIWNAAIELVVSQEPCTKPTKPCTLHPGIYQGVPGSKSPRASACEAKEMIKRRFQKEFQERIGVRCYFPEPSGGNSNTGNLATRCLIPDTFCQY